MVLQLYSSLNSYCVS